MTLSSDENRLNLQFVLVTPRVTMSRPIPGCTSARWLEQPSVTADCRLHGAKHQAQTVAIAIAHVPRESQASRWAEAGRGSVTAREQLD